MSPDKMRIAIAKHRGETCDNCGEVACDCYRVGIGSGVANYPEDLNAIREAVLALPEEKQWVWEWEVAKITGSLTSHRPAHPFVQATALDWCRAYLVVTGLWEEAG